LALLNIYEILKAFIMNYYVMMEMV